ncbi:alpha/beta hydrolase family protein [Solitalea lacus]|uniref:alpha/beta hydrolase family protein n=1 Tax=Solitalea lacus TaxID=2911172 RepID=UPI001EDB6329|nr:alpha/beta hydrolase [Solitalea lacus]UKJ06424.1 alpha/beta hydrolase [Solitalea lacus]
MKKKLSFILGFIHLISFSYAQQVDISGDWFGGVDVGVFLRISFHITKTENGLKATMDSPDQKAFGIPVDEVTVLGDSIRLKINRINFSYHGSFNPSQQTIQGKFSQNLLTKEMNLSRKELAPRVDVKHFQEPKPPFAYYTEDIGFDNTIDNIRLSGTFTRPKAEGKYPTVVLISGSGPQDRDETISGHKLFLVIADYLTNQGFAVLRFDDRGFGQSTGSFANSSLYNFADDVRSAIEYLKKRSDVNVKQIGLVGHSEGGYIAPLIASTNKDVAYLVLLAAPGTKGEQVLLEQSALLMRANNAPQNRIDLELETIERCASIIKEADKNQEYELKKEFDNYFTKLSQLESLGNLNKDAFIASRINIWMAPWFVNFLKFDPTPYLIKIKCPVLALNGTKDLQVPYQSNLSALKSALDRAGNKRCTFAAMEGLNHLFQTANKGTVDEYQSSAETFSPKALQLIGDWLKQHINEH